MLAAVARDAINQTLSEGVPAAVTRQGPLAFVPEWRGGQWVWVPCCVILYAAPEQPQGSDPQALLGFGGRFLVQKLVVPGAADKVASEEAWTA